MLGSEISTQFFRYVKPAYLKFFFSKLVVSLLLLSVTFTDALSLLLLESLYLDNIFEPEVAIAATGDFATFSETSGGEAVNSNGTPFDVTWDNTVDSNSNITLQANTSDIDLADGGKYLVLYNTWVHEGGAGGTNRRGVDSYLTLAGTQLPYGRGAGYIRDTETLTTAWVNGSAIIDAVAGDDLQLHVKRNEGNPIAGTEMAAGSNGVSVIKLPDDNDYLRSTLAASSSNISSNTTFTDVQWDTTDELDTDSFGLTPTSADITLKGADGDYFIVNVNVGLYVTAGGITRQNYEMILTLDGTEIPGTAVTSYLRGTNDTWEGQLVYTGLIAKDAAGDQTLNVEVRRESDGGATTVIMADRTSISMMSVSDTAEVVRLTDGSGTQTLSNTAVPLTFDTQEEINTGKFSHSLVTNTDRIEIDSADDYLFFATAYSTTSASSNDREPFEITWNVTGTDVTRGAFASFNRDNSTYTSGASGALLLSGLTASDYVAMEQVNASSDTVDNAVFSANRVAVQGIALNDNFYGLDTVVGVNGSHTTTADIATTGLYTGGQFTIIENTTSRNVTSLTIDESGTVDGSTGIENVELYYDLDTSDPYDCASESYAGTELQYGSTDSNGFSGADGSSSFSDTVAISPTQALCLYPVMDVTSGAADSETVIISIDTPLTDIVVTGGAALGPADTLMIGGSTVLRNAELTQTHYQWLNDDGVEGSATSIEGAEDTPAIGFANGTIRRLRTQISAEGSTSSVSTTFRLEYGKKVSTCDAIGFWTDVGAVGGDWDMANSSFITDGNNSSDLIVANGGTTNENTTHLATNGALRDTSSQTGSLIFAATNFLELEYALQPTATALQGNTYCFRLSNAGTALRNYDIYPEGTISADVDVSATSTHVASLDVGSNAQYLGGGFVIGRPGTTRTVTSITLSEVGTIDAAIDLANIELFYDLDTTAPYDCTGESYVGGETQFGSTDTDGFSSENGTSTFTGSETISNTRSMCLYVVLDIDAAAVDGETIEVQIADPSTEVVVTSSSVGPSTAVSPSASTTIAGPVLTQTHYHWRNDDGNEAGATSASGDVEDTSILNVPKETTYRLRLQVSNEGSVSSPATTYRLEYGTKLTTCGNIASWTDVGAVGGAWDMSLSSNITDANTTDIALASLGAMTDENTNFIGTGALRETTSDSGSITLTSTQFTELEYSIEATIDSGYDTDYCFRVSDLGAALNSYIAHAELTTREKQDFFIQRGDETVSGTGLTLTAGVDYVAPSATSAAFVRITNSQLTGAGDNSAGGSQNADDTTAYISDQSDITSSFTISRPTTAISNTRVSWEIIEFVGLAGSDNEMVVRGVGEMTLASTNFYATGTAASGVINDNDIVVFVTGQANDDAGRTNMNDGLFTASWAAATDQAVMQRAEADSATAVSYAVVEFTGANWEIQRTEHTYTTAGSIETEVITVIPGVSKGFVHAQKRVGGGNNGLDEQGHQVWLSSLGTVSFKIRSGATTPASHVSVAWIIANIQSGDGSMLVTRSSGIIASGGPEPNTNSIPIGVTVNTSNSTIFATNDTAGTGTAFPRVFNGFSIASTTHYELWQSDTGQNVDFRTSIVEWPVAETSVRQNYYRFYVDNGVIDPTDPWPVGISNLGENTTITSADDPLGEGESVRIRMSLLINNATLPENIKSFKLQYGLQVSSCSAVSVWTDVGGSGSGEIWRGYDGVVADGTEIATSTPSPDRLNISVSDVAGTYEEFNDSAINPYSVDIGEDVEYDWLVEHNGAAQRSDYCFRMINSDDTELDGYIHYPTLRTTGYTPVIYDWRWYDDEVNDTPSTALAAENVAPIDIVNNNIIKLRVISSEVENAVGMNIKYSLQYSQYADFSDGGTVVASNASCSATSTWCYGDGGGADNVVIQTSVLTNTDACVVGVGNGCGTHNEIATTTSSLTHAANAKTEFEFTIKHAGARANGVYYFRLFDEGAGEALVASSTYPSLVTEGAQLVSTLSGITSGTSVAGIVTDVNTTPSSIGFGALPVNTSYEAVQRIAIDTNATEGYQLLMYATQQLTNTYGDVIPAVTGTNAVPAGWATVCTGSMTGCMGYHATDATLGGGSSRFGPIDSYAALDTTPQEIMYSSIPANDVHEVVYRVLVTEAQAAGDYQTSIIYLSIPVF